MHEDEGVAEDRSRGVSGVPFSAYLLAWVLLAVSSFTLLRDDAARGAVLWSPEYGAVVAAGLVLVALGPALSVAVWLFARAVRPEEARTGLLADALLKGAGATLLGTVLWLVALVALDICCAGA